MIVDFLKEFTASAIEDQTIMPDKDMIYTSFESKQGTTAMDTTNSSPEDIYLRRNRFHGTIADINLEKAENTSGMNRLTTINRILSESKRKVLLDDGTRAYLYDDGSILYEQEGELTDGTIKLENQAERAFRQAGYRIGPDTKTYEQQNDPDEIFDENNIRFVEQRRLERSRKDDASRIRGRLLSALHNYMDNPYPESEERKFVNRVLESLYDQAENSAMIGTSEVHELPDGTILQINNLSNILDTIEREESIRRRDYVPQYVEEDDPKLSNVIDLSDVKVLSSKHEINRAKDAFGQTGEFQFGLLQRLSRSEPPDRLSVVRTARDPIVREREISSDIDEGVDLKQLEENQESELERLSDPEIRKHDELLRDNREDIIERILSGESYEEIAESYDTDSDTLEMFYTGRDKSGNVFIGAFRPRDIALAKRRRRDMSEHNPPEDQMFSEARSNDSEIKWRESDNPNIMFGRDSDGYEYEVRPHYEFRDKYSTSIFRMDNVVGSSSREGEIFDTQEGAMQWADQKLQDRVEQELVLSTRRGEYGGKGIKPTKDNIDLAVAIAYHKYIGSLPEMQNNPYEDTDLTPSMMARDLLDDPVEYGDSEDKTVLPSEDMLRTPVSNKDEVVDFIEKTAMDLAIEDHLEGKSDRTCPEDQMFSEDRQLREIVDRIQQGDIPARGELNERRRQIVEEARRKYATESAEVERRKLLDEERESTASDIEEYLEKVQEFKVNPRTSPEDQYLMVNVHGAYERDPESRRNIDKADNILLFDTNVAQNKQTNNKQEQVTNFFNSKRDNKSNILQNLSQREKLSSKRNGTPENNAKLDTHSGSFGKISFGSYGKKDNILLNDENTVINNTNQYKIEKENKIIKNGVMAQARRLNE